MTENERRIPTQARARASYEAILEAAFQILDDEGLDRLNTNLVAERAGVSIGTLYQYFSNRDEILAELGQRAAASVRDAITQIVVERGGAGNARAIIRALMTGMPGKPETRVALTDALFSVRGEGVVTAHHFAMMASLAEQSPEPVKLAPEPAFVLTHAVVCLLRAANVGPGLKLDPAALEDELVLLLESYMAALVTRAANTT